MKIKDAEKSRVLSTKDYKIFSYDKERVFRKRVDLIKVSMLEKNLSKDLPIIIDSGFRILDGRHRFIANVELKEPVFYKVAEVSNHLDLLKASTLTKKPVNYDFLLAHKDKLFYKKMIEYTKLLPYSCDSILEFFYFFPSCSTVGLGSRRWSRNSNYYRDFVNGKCEFKKEYDFKVEQIDTLVNLLYDNHNYLIAEIQDVDSILSGEHYSAEVTYNKIKVATGIKEFFSLNDKGHPDLGTLEEYLLELSEFEESEDDIDAVEEKYNRWGDGTKHKYVAKKYPNLILINTFCGVKYKKLEANSQT